MRPRDLVIAFVLGVLGLIVALPHSPLRPEGWSVPTMNLGPRSGPVFPIRSWVLVLPLVLLGWAVNAWQRRSVSWRQFVVTAYLAGYLGVLAIGYAQFGNLEVLAHRVHTISYAKDAYLFEEFSTIWNAYDAQERMTGHGRTHPPGAVTAFWLAQRVGGMFHGDEDGGYRTFVQGARISGFLLPAIAGLWLFPLGRLARRRWGERTGAVTVALGAVVPSLLVIAPCMEGLLPLLLATALLVLERGLAEDDPRFTVLAGAFGVAGTFLSFASGAAGFVLFGVVLAHRGLSWKRRSIHGLALGAGALGLVALGPVLLGYNPAVRFLGAVGHHVDGPNRPYSLFLLLGPFAFFLWSGPIVSWNAFRSLVHDRLGQITFCVLGILALSGIVRGENERLWLAFLPFLLLSAGAACERDLNRSNTSLGATLLVLSLGFSILLARVLDHGSDYFR